MVINRFYSLFFCSQNCVKILNALQDKEFGRLPESTIVSFRAKCRGLFPRASVFADEASEATVAAEGSPPMVNGVAGPGALGDSETDKENTMPTKNHADAMPAVVENRCSHGD